MCLVLTSRPYFRHHEAARFAQSNTGSDLARLYNALPGGVPFDDFDPDEHKRNLELLLSQERVVALIYAKTFPIAAKAGTVGGGGGLDRHTRTVGIGMPSRPVATRDRSGPGYGGGAGGNQGHSSPTDNLITDSSLLAGSTEEGNRPQTTGALNTSSSSNQGRSEKFPPILSATGQAAARMASR